MRTPGPRMQDRDAGASLILAIAFVVMIGSISAGLAGLVTSSLNNRGSLELVRNRQYAADGAIEEAIAQLRFEFEAGAPLAACAAADGFILDDPLVRGIAIRVDWRNECSVVRGSDGTAVVQRNVVFSACLDPGVECPDADVIISAQVNFQQGPSGAVTKTYVQSWSVNR